MTIEAYLEQLSRDPQSIDFETTISVIDNNYNFTPGEFKNGTLLNAENQNNGSCKIFAFAQLHQLSETQTLHCFGDYYRKDVLEHPDADDHQNIRNFMASGWQGISFSSTVLTSL